MAWLSVIGRVVYALFPSKNEVFPINNGCGIKQYGDHQVCSKCGLVWDVNGEPEPYCEGGHNA